MVPSGRDEDVALAALASYAPRYAPVAAAAGIPFQRSAEDESTSSRRCPVTPPRTSAHPARYPSSDAERLTAAEARRQAALVEALVGAGRGGGRGAGDGCARAPAAVAATATRCSNTSSAPSRRTHARSASGTDSPRSTTMPPSRPCAVTSSTAFVGAGRYTSVPNGWPPRYAAQRISGTCWTMRGRSRTSPNGKRLMAPHPRAGRRPSRRPGRRRTTGHGLLQPSTLTRASLRSRCCSGHQDTAARRSTAPSTTTTSRRPRRRSATTGRANFIAGPLFLGKDTHALSEPAYATALEVLAANEVTVLVDPRDRYTPTPALCLAILMHNAGRRSTDTARADGIVVTPSHNPTARRGLRVQPARRRARRQRHHRLDPGPRNDLLRAGMRGVDARAAGPGPRGRLHAALRLPHGVRGGAAPPRWTWTRSAPAGLKMGRTPWAVPASTTGRLSPSGTSSTSPWSTRSSTRHSGS